MNVCVFSWSPPIFSGRSLSSVPFARRGLCRKNKSVSLNGSFFAFQMVAKQYSKCFFNRYLWFLKPLPMVFKIAFRQADRLLLFNAACSFFAWRLACVGLPVCFGALSLVFHTVALFACASNCCAIRSISYCEPCVSCCSCCFFLIRFTVGGLVVRCLFGLCFCHAKTFSYIMQS